MAKNIEAFKLSVNEINKLCMFLQMTWLFLHFRTKLQCIFVNAVHFDFPLVFWVGWDALLPFNFSLCILIETIVDCDILFKFMNKRLLNHTINVCLEDLCWLFFWIDVTIKLFGITWKFINHITNKKGFFFGEVSYFLEFEEISMVDEDRFLPFDALGRFPSKYPSQCQC